MKILVINCGSSSAKYQLFDVAKKRSSALRRRLAPMVSQAEPLAKGIVERIGEPRSCLKHERGKKSFNAKISCPDHYIAIKLIADILVNPRWGVISSIDEIGGVGHRAVHGGEEFKESTIVTNRVIRSVEKYSELAPLHNPPSLLGIRAAKKIFKGIPQAACFDTAFHHTMPPVAFLYAVPYALYKRYGIRRYGFHGTSHRFVAGAAARLLKRPLGDLRLITCHLGNGCSMTAVDRGRSVDTSMGFTPLEGLIMGTRSGDIDPAVALHLLEKGFSAKRINDILNKESGLLGVSGISNDMRDLVKGPKRARLAIEMFIYRIKKYIGAYQAAMGKLDAVIFTAGIGENHPWLVKRIARELKNVVSKKTAFMVVPTNEELLIAKDTYRIITKKH